MPRPNIENEHILVAMRQMAWSRAKGELLSILDTYWYAEEEFKEIEKLIDEFIEKIENDSPLA